MYYILPVESAIKYLEISQVACGQCIWCILSNDVWIMKMEKDT